MATRTETINIVVREDGSRVVSRNLEGMGRSAGAADKGIAFLKRTIGGLVAGAAINQLRQLADTFTTIQNRLRLTTTDQGNLNAVFNELQAISTRTRSSLEANTELYSRMSLAAKSLGISQKEVLQFTESVNKAIKISGASAAEAEGGLRQLSQGLASGALRGDELNSVMENLPAVADVVAKSLGITRGQLRQMGQEGKITGDIILKAFREAREELDEKFKTTVPTIGEGFVLLKNQILETVGSLDKATGGTSALGKVFLDVVGFIKKLTPELVNFVRALTGSLDPMDEMSNAGKVFASIFIVVGSVIQGIAKILTTVVIGAFRAAGKNLGAFAAALDALVHGRFSEAGNIVKDRFTEAVTDLVGGTKDLYADLVGNTTDTIEKLVQVWDKGARQVQDRRAEVVGKVDDQSGKPAPPPGPTPEEIEKQRAAYEKLRNELISVLNQISPLEGAQREMAKAVDILNQAQKQGLITKEQEIRYLEELKAKYADILNPLAALNRELDQQAKLLGLTARQRAVEAQVLEATKGLLDQGVKLTQEEVKALRDKYQALQDLNEAVGTQDQLLSGSVESRRGFITQIEGIQKLLANPTSGFSKGDATNALSQATPGMFEGTQELIDAQVERFKYMYEQIDILRQADLISDQAAAQMRMKVDIQQAELRLQNAQSFFGNLATLSRNENSKLAAIGKAAAVAQATIDGVLAVQKALASAPPPVNYALAAAVAVSAAANVSQILSAKTGFATGGQFTVGGGGGTDSQMVAFRATPGERVAVSTPQQVRKGDPGQGGAPIVVQAAPAKVIVVDDPKKAVAAMQSTEGENVTLQHIRNNREALRRELA